jgi:hypothetical protein
MMKDRMMNEDLDVENVGIMQGFMDSMRGDEDEGDEDTAEMEGDDYANLGRRPDSPEILMNNLRGDMRSIEARRDELADLVGYAAAAETPEPVLAMLQQVLAGQGPGAAGGIGALPPSMDMAQGPQPPMAPPQMPPGMPGAPGAEMAPPPTDGGIAELLAAAGGAPGGAPVMPPDGALAMPAEGSPNGPPPMQMARGGIVQRFQAGSDEDGVTPAGAGTSSLGFTPTPEMLAQARTQFMNTLSQPPLAVPDLKSETERRTQMYQDILGDNTDSRQAQLLLSLGQRALGFAGNVDDQGRPLRGSFLSRAAQSARTLPAEMSQFISAADKEQRQARMLGLQAAEKEIETTRGANLKLLETQRKGYADILKAAGKAKTETGPFGSGLDGRSLEMFVKHAPAYAKNELDPETERYFLSAVTNYTQPTLVEFTDPLTGEKGLRERRNDLPDFVRTALKARGTSVPAAGGRPSATGTGQAPRPEPIAAGGAAVPVTPSVGPRPAPVVGATSADLPAEVAPIVQGATQSTFFDLASTGTGFVPVLVSGIARNVPLEAAGRIRPEFQQATTMLENMRNRVVNVLQESPRFAEGERTQILRELNLGPRLLDNKQSFINQIVAVDNVFDSIESKTKTLTGARNTGIEKRREAFKKLEEVNFIRDLLGVRARKIDNTEQWKSAAPGEYLVLDPTRKIYVYAQKKGGQ